jgi:dCMP deaminase
MTPGKAYKYLEVARVIAQNFSKDQSTKVGCVIVGPSGESRAWGYNGSPRGCVADEDERGVGRPEKYYWLSHAELNAITNAASIGTPLKDSTLIVTHPPCMDCARAIVQAGIKEVWAASPSHEFKDRWHEHTKRTHQLFGECGVSYFWI